MEILHLPVVTFNLCMLCIGLCSTIYVSGVEGVSNVTDRLALLDLKAGLIDGPYGTLSLWNDSIHFCQWPGVVCGSGDQRVTALRLDGLALGGSISPSIGNLTYLSEIQLASNSLKGTLPKEIGQLSRMQVFNLTKNSLTGEIPAELTNCSNLESISLSDNNFVGDFPSWFGYLSKLTHLEINKNNITGVIPQCIGNLSSLVVLSVSRNNIMGSIPDLGGLKDLSTLSLSQNRLSGTLPSSICNLSSLELLSVADNILSGQLLPNMGLCFPKLWWLSVGICQFSGELPSTLGNMSSLEVLDAGTNYLTGRVPDNLGVLKNLNWLSVEDNRLGGTSGDDFSFLGSFMNATKLEVLSLAGNGFRGVFPSSIVNLSSITWLTLGSNGIYGEIPESIGNLVNLTIFAVENNSLTGRIPSSICTLENLGQLGLQFNQLSGSVPSCLGNLKLLFLVNLGHNNFSGEIPLSLANCSSMQHLFFASNQLSGRIPANLLGQLPQLISVRLDQNSLTGSFPPDVGSLKHLMTLIASNNKLSGAIPETLGNCLNLEYIDLSGNYFHGSLPTSLSNLKGIRFLNLSRNNLSSSIPEELQGLQFMEHLNLSFNQLEGQVPRKGVFANAKTVSVAGNKGLCGGIPLFNLPVCASRNTRVAKKLKLPLKWIVAVTVSCSLCVVLITIIYIVFSCERRKNQNVDLSQPFGANKFLMVSYKELFDATDGFAHCNLIGTGQFGCVYRGFLSEDERPVAVKVMNLQKHGASSSFTAECEALRTVRHRNLVKIITACSSMDNNGNNFKAFVLQLMPNGSLESWLHNRLHEKGDDGESGYLNLSRRLDIALDVAHALEYLHRDCETPIVHCDLKPSNVLLDDDLVAHVSDFGLAKLFARSGGTVPISSSVVRGTIGYVAPEYGLGCSVSPEGDIYSYGILLLEMITGKKPTDEMFIAGISLHNYCKMALPDDIQGISDPSLFEESYEERHMKEYRLRCLVSLVQVGVKCSAELPGDRMKVADVVIELGGIKARIASSKPRSKSYKSMFHSEPNEEILEIAC
ncbi:unnamed protein product [Linum tenue]|uniref:non-specific serine/threonine protein kinase n=1 Tax=Linum tenue TaxID=586396 RepID=A0AAV0K4L3_9ROSI|nr:unnamed protein product [Linum tenue]